ncbi:MAG: hypothetical protein GY886_05265 [Gammaproteobacteria bacterium]|nr:hypothetical protein [Gammaproteobacteria bacterium]MCP4927830.1 hypothetical protein [Gammaproteobacteria bacterium]
MSDGLSGAILNQEDPELVREALPSYLLLLDGFARSNPDNVDALSAAAQLYTAYGAALIDDPVRSAKLTAHAKDYGEQALCASNGDACGLDGIDFDQYEAIIRSTGEDDVLALFSYSLSTLAWIRFNSTNFDALVDLPKMEVALDHLYSLDPGEYKAATCMYLGVLNTLRPPALGGKPELAREWFERGISLSEGRDLSIKVEYARGYARLLYDRELYDRLLNEVMQADVKQSDLTLFNVLAQEQAAALLASADDYF